MTTYNSNFEGCFPFSDQTAQLALAATTALTYTVPGTDADSYRCEISVPYNANVWVGYNLTATIPAPGTITSKNRIELISHDKYVRYVRGGDVLSFISDSLVTNVGLSLLQLPSPR